MIGAYSRQLRKKINQKAQGKYKFARWRGHMYHLRHLVVNRLYIPIVPYTVDANASNSAQGNAYQFLYRGKCQGFKFEV